MSVYTATDETTGHRTTIGIQNRTKDAAGIDITIQNKEGNVIAHEWIGIMKTDIFRSMLGISDLERAALGTP